jgi:DNA-binding transcriptional LysR family regulator
MHALMVAEHLSFRRAAIALGVRQSAVSRRIRELENRLGVSLFERHRPGVRVTNAGIVFLRGARSGLQEICDAAKAAGAAGRGAVGRVRIGTLSSIGGGFLRELMRRYSREHPGVALEILEGAVAEHLGALAKRQIDLAFILRPADAGSFEVTPLWSERIFVAIPHGHALAQRKEVEWRDLHKEHLVMRRSDHEPALCDRLIRCLAADGQAPYLEKLEVSRGSLMHLVAVDRGLGLTSESTAATGFPNVVFRPIVGDDAVLQFCAVWQAENDNPALRRFLSVARTLARERKEPPGTHQTGPGPTLGS